MTDAPPQTITAERILLSNDDGIAAPGLKLLERVAKGLSREVWIVAPEIEQSGAGHSLTMRRPLRIRKVSPKRYAVDGTPTDAVLLAINQIMANKPPSLVLSGINRGGNVAEDVTYSGTIAAAIEATLLGAPAIAFSQGLIRDEAVPWATAEQWAPIVIQRLVKAGWPKNVLINVNFPACAADAVRGIAVTRLGRRKLTDELGERIDLRGEPYYWIGPPRHEREIVPGTDLAAVAENRVSITPIKLDFTDDATLPHLRKAFA